MRKHICRTLMLLVFIILLGTVSCTAQTPDIADLVGTWQFMGGGELMGYGFQLHADGTGQWLDSIDMEHCPPKHLFETGQAFTWELNDDCFLYRNHKGTTMQFSLSCVDHRMLFTEEESGGFYAKFDEKAIRAEIEDRIQRGTITTFDALVMDYLHDSLENTLASLLHLRSVNAYVDWYHEEKSITVDAWQQDLDQSITIRFTASGTTVSTETTDAHWSMSESADTGFTANAYYQAVSSALRQVMEQQTDSGTFSGNITSSVRELRENEAEIISEIEQKRLQGTSDDFDDLTMEAIDGTLITKLETMGLSSCSTWLNWENPLHTILVDAQDIDSHRYIALRMTPCTIGAYVGNEYSDAKAIPISAYSTYLRIPAQTVYDQFHAILQSELAWIAQHQQVLLSLPTLSGSIGSFSKGQTYEVYRGPGKHYGRGARGKASVSTNGTIWVYGLRGNWMFISYEISGGHTRYGWINTAGVPTRALSACPNLVFPGDDGSDHLYATVRNETHMVDMVHSDEDFILSLLPGSSVHCLASVDKDWALVEVYASGRSYLGLVPWKDIDLQHGYASARKEIGHHTLWSEEEILSAMQSVEDSYTAKAAGHTLLSLRYDDEDSDPASVNWPTDVPAGIEWIKFYGTACSISYYDFEIADSDGIAEDLVFYVFREPNGPWIGDMGGYE